MKDKIFLDLKQIHEEQKKMLQELDQFCKKENITYYICGGTLLGAIRHRGFIPWDDDIDVLMPRPDYERFHEIIKENNYNIRKNIIIRSFKYDNLLLPYCKIMNTNLKMETHYYENKYDNYLWIDIFPMDGLPESDMKTKKIYKKILFLRRILSMVEVKDEIIETESKKKWMIIPKKIIRKACSNEEKIKKIVHQIDKLARKYKFEESKYVGRCTLGIWSTRKTFKSKRDR